MLLVVRVSEIGRLTTIKVELNSLLVTYPAEVRYVTLPYLAEAVILLVVKSIEQRTSLTSYK